MTNTRHCLIQVLLLFIVLCPYSSFSQQHEEHFHQNASDSLRHIWQDETLENELRLEALDHLAYHVESTGHIEALFSLYEELYDFANQREMPDRVVQALDMLGMISTRFGYSPNELPSYDNAIHFCSEGIEIAKKINDERLPQLYMNQGTGYAIKQDFDRAMENYLLAYQLLENKKDSVSQQYLGMTAYRLARIYYRGVGDIEKAIDYWEKALAVAEESEFDLDFIKVNALVQLGYQYYDSGELDRADTYLTTAYNLGHKVVPQDHYLSVTNLASVRIEQRRNEEAMSLIREYEALGKELGYGDQKAMINDHIGKIHLLSDELEEALKYYRIALAEVEKENNYDSMQTYRWQIFLINKKLGNYEEALNFFLSHIEAKDSVYNADQQRQVYRQESRYEYEKQAFADSLAFAQKEALTNLELERNKAVVSNQRLGLITAIAILLLLGVLTYSIFKNRQRIQLEADRVKELDAFKSTFYTNITHEFRTPLTVILGMAQQIKEKPQQYMEEGVALIERNGKNLLKQINQILDLSKLETNALNLQMVQGDIIKFLRYSTEAFQSFANGKNLSLRFFSPVESLEMDYDPDSLQNVMSNLLSNALKFTPEGGDVKTALEIDGNQLIIKIIDTGIGIAAKNLLHVFDRFYQAENSSAKENYGSGIGLAYTKALVQLMNGTISIASELGKGSVFSIVLQIQKEAITKSVEEQINSMDWKPKQAIQNLVIASSDKEEKLMSAVPSNLPQLLLIEDNADVVTYLKSCLEDQYQIDVAFNGRIGIEKAIENIPDLIISDVMMPEKDGYEVCDTLKNDERTSHIPITLLTAKADVASKIVGLRRGADAYLSKPFDKEELLVRLEMMVEKQKKLAAYFAKDGESKIEVSELEEAVKIEHEFIQKVQKIVAKYFADDQFGLPQLCQKVGMSRSQLYRKMKALIDTSPSGFIRTYRLEKAKILLETTDLNVSEVAWDTGFTNLTHFGKVFQEEFGVLPSVLKR